MSNSIIIRNLTSVKVILKAWLEPGRDAKVRPAATARLIPHEQKAWQYGVVKVFSFYSLLFTLRETKNVAFS